MLSLRELNTAVTFFLFFFICILTTARHPATKKNAQISRDVFHARHRTRIAMFVTYARQRRYCDRDRPIFHRRPSNHIQGVVSRVRYIYTREECSNV